ncbi:MAG: hypothetical protein QM598_02035 [Protaetiibacter sp.]
MRFTPGAAVVGVTVGSTLAQTATVLFFWVNIGPHYYATTWTLYAIETIPLWLIATAHLVEAALAGLLPAIVLVPVLRRWPTLQRPPGCVVAVVVGVAIACIPFVALRIYPYPGALIFTVVSGSAIALVAALLAGRVIRRRVERDAAALAAAFED